MREAVVKVLAVAVLAVALAYALLITARDEAKGQVESLPVSPYDAELNEIDRKALHDAYEQHVEKLFETWMRDPTDQPRRALVGIRNGRKAYIDAMTAIDARK